MLEKVIRYEAVRHDKVSVWESVWDVSGGKAVGEPQWYVDQGDKLVPVNYRTVHISDNRYKLLSDNLAPQVAQFKDKKMSPEDINRFENQIYQFCRQEDYKGSDGKLVCIAIDSEKGKLQLLVYHVRKRGPFSREKKEQVSEDPTRIAPVKKPH